MPHPYVALCRNGKRIDEHRLIAGCQDAGPDVIVHHVDGDTKNNATENLEVMTRSDHAKHHGLGAQIRPWAMFLPDDQGMAACKKCGQRKPFDQFPRNGKRGSRRSTCNACRSKLRKDKSPQA